MPAGAPPVCCGVVPAVPAAAAEEQLGARPPTGAAWLVFDAANPVSVGGDATVWLRAVLGTRRSRATALVL